MARAFWKGVISFGMVAIPVKMYVATQASALNFHLLHKKCLTRPKQVLYCQEDEEYFSLKDTVRGYEYARGQYIVLEESDFKKVPVKTTHSISIVGFVDLHEVDPVYYHGSHYLEPEELGVKPFALLREALIKTQRIGLAKVTFQRREHLCTLRPLDDILILHTMFYPEEVLPRSELAPPKQELSSQELEMATSLIKVMNRSFKPQEYRDEYRLALENLVQSKLKGVEIKMPKAPKVEMADLMAALRASVETAKKEREAVPAGAKR